jgi:phosphate transport system substrate-binding protein
MKRLTPLFAATAALAVAACGQGGDAGKAPAKTSGSTGGARQQVWAAGSSTVFPFATRVSEQVSRTSGGQAARVESLGTGGGIKLFCSGTGAAFPDVATASRKMKKSEWDACAAAGVKEIVELKIGYDGIVIADAKGSPPFALKLDQIYRALAAEVPQGSGFVPNPAKTWKDVDAALPAERITVYGPPPTSGTRDAFVELGMEGGAKKLLADLKASNEDEFKQRAHTIRSDGAWIDAGENDNAMVQTLVKTPNAVGVFGYSFLENNGDKVQAASIDGVAPTLATISDGSYPLSRSLYIYVKKANVGVTPGLREFVNGFVSDAAIGKGGYLIQRGLIPLHTDELAGQKQAVTDLAPMAAPEK